MGLASGRLQLSGAYFYTENTNVIFVVDASAVPPIFNQDDDQRVSGVAVGLVGRITPAWDVSMSVQYLDSRADSQNPALDGQRLILAPEVLRQPLDDGAVASATSASAAASATPTRRS